MRLHRGLGVLTTTVLALAVLVGLAPAAEARPPIGRSLTTLNRDLWRTLLPIPEAIDDPNAPFNTGVCLGFDHVLAPFSGGGKDLTCTATFGRPVFIAGYTVEWSRSEALDSQPPLGTSRRALTAEALRQLGTDQPLVCYDGRRLDLDRVVSPTLARTTLPTPNLLNNTPRRSTRFASVGDVTAVVPAPGKHTIVITQPATRGSATNTTYLYVSAPAHWTANGRHLARRVWGVADARCAKA